MIIASTAHAESDIQGDKAEPVFLHYYKPIYVAYGNPITKLQYGFRTELSDRVPFNFAYSQVIFWYLSKQTKPFLDATYNPEFFYRLKVDRPLLHLVDFGFFEHNSNGKAGEQTAGVPLGRSYDQSYIRFFYSFDPSVQLSVKLRQLYDIGSTNKDISNYIGPVEIEARYGDFFKDIFDRSEVSVDLSPGGHYADRWDLGGYQVSSTLHISGMHFTPAFYIQYYHGYAESLIDYDHLVDVWRAGLRF